MRRWLTVVVILIGAAAGEAQLPQTFRNLQHYPKDIVPAQLTQHMREFSVALGVRCQHCHTGGDGVSFEGVDFASDDKVAKVKARAMLRMVDQLNGPILGALPARAEPRVVVDCATCHRGVAVPKSLQTTLFELATRDGVPAAAARYRELRREGVDLGRYNFGAWELMELSRRLREADNADGAIAILELNGEFHADAAAIDFELGEMLRQKGDRDGALARYRAALKKAPDMAPARRRIDELEKKPQ
jgi:Photosynthetic reaction centre cytochrome C subunit